MIVEPELVIECDSCGVKLHTERLTHGGARLYSSEYGWESDHNYNKDYCPKCAAKIKEGK